ncbi:MAG TPA: hypothetical protein VFE17_05615 [Candidatus Baltobacteraceae bacterium]|jgi:hypothetical protein|nr:hypothetical protein [Candidatus Baltobacteraceae bacterium]
MFIQVIHNITDTSLWSKRLADFEKQEPSADFTLHCSGTAADHTKAFCLWEAQSVNALQSMLDAATDGAAQNIYYTLDEKAPATRLPRSVVAT